MGGHGKCAGVVGGNVRRGHWHSVSPGPAMPVLMQGSGMGLVTEDKLAVLVLSQDPTVGKLKIECLITEISVSQCGWKLVEVLVITSLPNNCQT